MDKRTFLKISSVLVAGTALGPVGSWAQDTPILNWAGNLTYSTTKNVHPQNVAEVISLTKKFPKFKTLGTKHCFNTIADSKEQFLSVDKLEPGIAIDKAAGTVSVAAGIRYGQLAEWLYKEGWALHNLASLPHISVAGACVTATHGSGIKNGNLSSAVRGLEFVTSQGNQVKLSKDKDGDQFAGAVVNLGAIGVITRMTLVIQPNFLVRQDVYEDLPLSQLEHHFDEIMGSGYSVSIFSNWQNQNLSQVWVKRKVEKDQPFNKPTDLFGAKPATRNLHPIKELSAENCTEQMGVPGPWHERLPHFKMNFTPSSGKELQSEFFVPRSRAYEAIMAVESLRDQIGPLLFITELRCIDGDDFWMSPCYKTPSLAIHFTWKQDWAGVSKLLPQIEEKLAPFNAKPHWGKLFTMSPSKFKTLYPRYEDFRKLVKEYDPPGKFRNDFLNSILT
jgi:xylitol oxidase